MKLPKTTEEKRYIEFRFYKDGKFRLVATNAWWGGFKEGFISSDGYEGNTCLPKDLTRYIKGFKNRKIKEIEKEIRMLQKRLIKIKELNL